MRVLLVGVNGERIVYTQVATCGRCPIVTVVPDWNRQTLTTGSGTAIGARFGRLAQLDRALASGAKGHRFESCNAH